MAPILSLLQFVESLINRDDIKAFASIVFLTEGNFYMSVNMEANEQWMKKIKWKHIAHGKSSGLAHDH